MLAEFSIYPTDETHMSRDVAKMVEILEDGGVDYRLGPMGTAVEGDWEPVMGVIRRCHETMAANHGRIVTTITIDQRKNQPHHLDEMVASVERHLGHAARRPPQQQTAGASGS